MGTHIQERSGSLENGICVTWSGVWLCPGYLWLLILVAVEQIYDQIDHTPTRSTESSASSPSDSESNSKLSAMEVIDGNDGVLAAGIAVAATM